MQANKKLLSTIIGILFTAISFAGPTIPIHGNIVKANNPGIQYIGRVDFSNPENDSTSNERILHGSDRQLRGFQG